MKLKLNYEHPVVDITEINTVDIITTSTPDPEIPPDKPPMGEWDTDL